MQERPPPPAEVAREGVLVGLTVRVGRVVGVVRRVGVLGAGEVEAGEQGLERRVAVDERGDVARPVLDGAAEAEEEEREDEEGGEVGPEQRRRFAEQLRRRSEILVPKLLKMLMMMMMMVMIAHVGVFFAKNNKNS